MQIKKLLKSKTLNFNAIVAAGTAICTAFGVPVSTPVVTAITTLGNAILRFFTTKPLSDK